MSMTLTQHIKKYIIDNNLFRRGDRIVVGVSGGADSVTLVTVLHQLQYELGIQIFIAHYNHNLRKTAIVDQRFVEKLSAQLRVPFITECWKNPPAKNAKGSLEDLARGQRLRFFKRVVKRTQAAVVALAHTRDDLAETMLMRILRGSGLQGLRGILPRREIDGIVLVRPLLEIARMKIEQFLMEEEIKFRHDPTNRNTKFFRNKVRLELLPFLEREYSSNLKEGLSNLANNMAVDFEYLQQQSEKVFGRLSKVFPKKKMVQLPLKTLKKQPQAMRRMVIRKSIEYLKGDTNRLTLAHCREIEDLISYRRIGAFVDLPGSVAARKDGEYLTILILE